MAVTLVGAMTAWCLAAPPPDSDHRTVVRPIWSEPQPTGYIDRARLAEDAAPDLPTVLDDEPGLHVTRLGGLGAFTTLSIRGSTPEEVLVVLDGIPLNGTDGAPVDLASLPLGPLESIAIYRGFVPLDLAETGLGGAIVLKSRAPRRTAAGAPIALEGELAVGSYTTRRARAFVGTPILSAAVDYLGSRGNHAYTNDMGTAWTHADDTRAARENADFDQVAALARAEIRLGDHALLTLLDLFSWSDRGLPGLGVAPTRQSRYRFLRDVAGARLDARWDRTQLQVLAHVAYGRGEVRDPAQEIGLAGGSTLQESLVPGVLAAVRVHLGPKRHAWRLVPEVGVSWRSEHIAGTSLRGATRERLATFAQASFVHQRSGLDAAAGVRLELLPEMAASLRAEVGTTALARTRFALAASSSHRLPSLFELHGDTGTTLGNADLLPERALAVELSARWDVPLPDPHTLALEAFAFVAFPDELIQFVQNAQGVQRPENVSSARLLGFECAARADLFSHLRLRLGAAFLDAIDTSDIAARRMKPLPLRPRLTLSARVEAHSANLGLALELTHLAGNTLDFAALVDVPARTLLGASLWAEDGPIRVTLTLSNLTSNQVQDLAGYPLPGLTGLATLRYAPKP